MRIKVGAVAETTLPAVGVEKQDSRKEKGMKIKIDWYALAKALLKAAWPFVAGALGGLVAGCTVNSPVP